MTVTELKSQILEICRSKGRRGRLAEIEALCSAKKKNGPDAGAETESLREALKKQTHLERGELAKLAREAGVSRCRASVIWKEIRYARLAAGNVTGMVSRKSQATEDAKGSR